MCVCDLYAMRFFKPLIFPIYMYIKRVGFDNFILFNIFYVYNLVRYI